MTPGKWHSKFIPLPQLTLQMNNDVWLAIKQVWSDSVVLFNSCHSVFDIFDSEFRPAKAKRPFKCLANKQKMTTREKQKKVRNMAIIYV